jgi:hypothetical protein
MRKSSKVERGKLGRSRKTPNSVDGNGRDVIDSYFLNTDKRVMITLLCLELYLIRKFVTNEISKQVHSGLSSLNQTKLFTCNRKAPD